jgi:flavin reductase (DIM6/NTAB) family NADH-FMN oxidoreductase RutF
MEDIMAKIELGSDRLILSYPMPCAIVGADVEGKANYITIAWFSMVNPEPPYIALAMNKAHYTNSGIKANKTFSVNIPSSGIAEKTDYCGMVSGRKFDKSAVFETFYGKLETAPMIKECPFNVECRLVQIVNLPAEDLFIGEIAAAYCDENCLTGGVPDLQKIDPFVLVMHDKKYRGLGREVGAAWDMGKKLIKK